MGTRTNILADHTVPDPLDRAAVLERLTPALSEAIAVRDFWNAYSPDERRDDSDQWEASPPCPPPHDQYVSYDAPGGFFVYFKGRLANVRATLRWRGFLSIESLRRAHLPAFRTIAERLGASRIVYLPDDDRILYDMAMEGASLDDCIAEMERRWGPPLASVEVIDPDVVEATEYGVPEVWHLEVLSDVLAPSASRARPGGGPRGHLARPSPRPGLRKEMPLGFRVFFEAEVPPYGTLGYEARRADLRDKIDTLASESGLIPLTAFESYGPAEFAGILDEDESAGLPPVSWYDASAGLAAVRALASHLKDNPGMVLNQAATLADLTGIESCLIAAQRAAVRFRFAVDLSEPADHSEP
jgi:hypothetical protein